MTYVQDLHPLQKELIQKQILTEDWRAYKIGLEAEQLSYWLDNLKEEADDADAGLDKARVYRFFTPVKTDTVEEAIEKLDFWSRRDGRKKKPMVIEFNSPGGDVLDGLALYDFIQELRRRGHHVTTVTRGMAASMGGILLQAGDVRVADENASILIHEVASGSIGKLNEMKDEVAFCEMLWRQRLLPILAKRSTLSVEQIKRRADRREWWLDANEALELGFVDRVDIQPDFT